MSPLPSTILPFLLPFHIIFRTGKTFSKICLLFLGATLCRGGRTICACLRILGMKGEQAFANYHHVLSQCEWDGLKAVEILIKMILPFTKGELLLVVDEHLERRKGKKIKAKDIYRDPVRSSKKWVVKCWGIKWVVLAIIIYFPWSKRAFALPIFCVPRRPEEHPRCKNRYCRTGIDILCQMLIVIRRKFPDLGITLVGDGDYARVKLVHVCNRLSIGLVTRLRSDARLHEHPTRQQWRGRRVKVGNRICPSIKKRKWEKGSIRGYGGKKQNAKWEACQCLWYAGKPEVVLPIMAIWVKLRMGDEIILMATNVSLTSQQVIEIYIKRWNLEVTFRDCRDYLGVETQRQWSDKAVERTTPLLFCLYSLIILIGHDLYKKGQITNRSTAWYQKNSITFSDLVVAVRKEIWKHRNKVNSRKIPSSKITRSSKREFLEELLAECF